MSFSVKPSSFVHVMSEVSFSVKSSSFMHVMSEVSFSIKSSSFVHRHGEERSDVTILKPTAKIRISTDNLSV